MRDEGREEDLCFFHPSSLIPHPFQGGARMVTRTRYGWMALGGLLVLFGIVLACKLRDGSRALAQSEPAAPPLLELKSDDVKTTVEPPLAPGDKPTLPPPVGKPSPAAALDSPPAP